MRLRRGRVDMAPVRRGVPLPFHVAAAVADDHDMYMDLPKNGSTRWTCRACSSYVLERDGEVAAWGTRNTCASVREAHDEIDRLAQEVIDAHIADRHPGQECREGHRNKCILGAPPEEVAEDDAAGKRWEERLKAERDARKPLETRAVWWCPNCRKEYVSGFAGHGQPESGCGDLTPVTITISRRTP